MGYEGFMRVTIKREPGESLLDVSIRLIRQEADNLAQSAHYSTLNRLADIANELQSIEDDLGRSTIRL